MSRPYPFLAVRGARVLLAALFVLVLNACAALATRDAPILHVVGVDPLPGEGLEMRFALKLRLQNPNDAPLNYDGVALELQVNGRPLASGVSDEGGSVPRFADRVLVVPVSVSAFDALRQALGLAANDSLERVPYVLRGKLAGGALGARRFADKGVLDLSRVLR